QLHSAMWRHRSAGIIKILLNEGVGLDAKRDDGRIAYALAIQTSQPRSQLKTLRSMPRLLAGSGTAFTTAERAAGISPK
ncbi:MAG: hypothetical protein WB676_04255, partial [Bryobacteraceae bacterium]